MVKGTSFFTIVALLLLLVVVSAHPAQADISGKVFWDKDVDGVLGAGDTGVANFTVTVTGSSGASASAVTAVDGTYVVPTAGLGLVAPLRVVFSKPGNGTLDHLQVGFASASAPAGGPGVAFVADGSTSVNLAVTYLGDTCVKQSCYEEEENHFDERAVVSKVPQSCAENVDLVTSHFSPGPRNGIWATSPAVVSFSQQDAGSQSIGWQCEEGNNPAWPGFTVLATTSQVGAVYGTAYDRNKQLNYVSAYQKRGADFGPGGPSAIYTVSSAGVVNQFVRLDDVFGAGTAGVDQHDLISASFLDMLNFDAPSIPLTHKLSFGDLDISKDGKTLYVVNLFDKRLYAIPTTGVLNAATIKRFDVPTAPGCGAQFSIPFGIGIEKAAVYVTATCVGPTKADLKAHVFKLGAGGFEPVPVHSFDFSAAFVRVEPWTDSQSIDYELDPDGKPTIPPSTLYQFTVTDLEFESGDMIFATRSRYNNMQNYGWLAPGWGGELFRSCYDSGAGVWVPESNGICGGVAGAGKTTFNKYYVVGSHKGTETRSAGGIFKVPGSELVAMANVPIWSWGSGNVVYAQDTAWAGGMVRSFEHYRFCPSKVGKVPPPGFVPADPIYPWKDYGNYQKLNGVGDVVGVCESYPTEIGNRVWSDLDGDGIQDPAEPSIAGVKVELLDESNAVVGIAVTDANGLYYFGGAGNVNMNGGLPLKLSSKYSLRIALDQPALSGVVPTLAKQGADAELDSDGSAVAGYSVSPAFFTSGSGQGDHSFDFGFVTPPPDPNDPGVNQVDMAGFKSFGQTRLAILLAKRNGKRCQMSAARAKQLSTIASASYQELWTTAWTKLPSKVYTITNSSQISAYGCAQVNYSAVIEQVQVLNRRVIDVGRSALNRCPRSMKTVVARRQRLASTLANTRTQIAAFPTVVFQCSKL